MDPRKMEQMMKQMGIDMSELDAEEVVIRTGDTELVFESPEVTRMDARGQSTYQIVGAPEEREASAGADDDVADSGVDDADVELVAQRAGVSESVARETLEAHDGDLAAAVAELE